MYDKAMLIYNGHAGSNDTATLLSEAVAGLSKHITEFTLMKTNEKGDTERLCRERGEQFDLVIIMGGDGTVHEAVNGLIHLEQSPSIFILPTGTCNDFARALNIPLKVKQACEVFQEAMVQSLDIGLVNDRAFSNFFGVGLITRASEGTNDDLKSSIGKFSYFLSAIQSLQTAESFSYSLQLDGKTVEDEAVMILAMNGSFLGTTNLYHEQTKLDDGKLELYIIREAGLALLKNLFNKARSPEWPGEMEGIEFIQADSLQLETSPIEDIDIDGEIYLETPARLSLKQKALPFLVCKEEK
ncbi:diacylglycerol kinase family protein [Alkalihalophilus sp. As8PL]|uniref:Diacylglycerol kinase family protein n=1 Tax=Alkalihalophilus sp. As8PL TaxID=3237103 RepID=A0AB39BSQ6_9BACI